MKQVLFGGQWQAVVSSSNTRFSSLSGGQDAYWNAAEAYTTACISTPGTISNLYVSLSESPGSGAGDAYIFTLRLNGADTALTCTITQPAVAGSDVAHSVAVVAGDTVCIQCAPSATPSASPGARYTVLFTGTNARESLILSSSLSDRTQTAYMRPGWAGDITHAAENDARTVCPTSGIIKNLYVELDSDIGTSPDGFDFTLRKNGASTDLHCHIVAEALSGNDTASTVSVVAGDILTIMVTPISSPPSAPWISLGMTFLADVDGESLVLGGNYYSPSTTTVEYSPLIAYRDPAQWIDNEASNQQLGQTCVLRKFYVLLSAAPGDAKSYTFVPRVNAGSPTGGLSVAITGAATVSGNDTTNSILLAANDNVSLMCTPAGTPAATDVYWGLVCFYSPTATVLGVPFYETSTILGIPTRLVDKVIGM